MKEISRRKVVLDGLLTVFLGSCCSSGAQAQVGGSRCWIPPGNAGTYFSKAGHAHSYRNGSEQIEPRSGDPALDRALVQSLAKLSRLFDVLPGFAYYRDDDSPNARATSAQLLDRTDGTVLMGLGFLQMLLSMPEHPDASVVAVCAHEYGHILSYKNGMIGQLDPTGTEAFRGEQFADFMAGYYAGSRKRENANYPAVVFATTQAHFGGGDHGSSQQRGEAVQEGFLAAYQHRLNLSAATDVALQFSLGRSLIY